MAIILTVSGREIWFPGNTPAVRQNVMARASGLFDGLRPDQEWVCLELLISQGTVRAEVVGVIHWCSIEWVGRGEPGGESRWYEGVDVNGVGWPRNGGHRPTFHGLKYLSAMDTPGVHARVRER